MAEIKAMTSQGEAMSRSLSESDLSEMCAPDGPPSPQDLIRSFSPSGGQGGHFQDRNRRRRRRKGSESSQGTLKEGEGLSSPGSQGLPRPALPPKSKRVLQQQQHMSGGPTKIHTRAFTTKSCNNMLGCSFPFPPTPPFPFPYPTLMSFCCTFAENDGFFECLVVHMG